MFPKRVFLGLGRGEALNEVPSGNIWPTNIEKFRRLRESIKLIKNYGHKTGLLLVENFIQSKIPIYILNPLTQFRYISLVWAYNLLN